MKHACVENKEGKFGYLSEQGKFLNPICRGEGTFKLDEGFNFVCIASEFYIARIKVNGQWGFIDNSFGFFSPGDDFNDAIKSFVALYNKMSN